MRSPKLYEWFIVMVLVLGVGSGAFIGAISGLKIRSSSCIKCCTLKHYKKHIWLMWMRWNEYSGLLMRIFRKQFCENNIIGHTVKILTFNLIPGLEIRRRGGPYNGILHVIVVVHAGEKCVWRDNSSGAG